MRLSSCKQEEITEGVEKLKTALDSCQVAPLCFRTCPLCLNLRCLFGKPASLRAAGPAEMLCFCAHLSLLGEAWLSTESKGPQSLPPGEPGVAKGEEPESLPVLTQEVTAPGSGRAQCDFQRNQRNIPAPCLHFLFSPAMGSPPLMVEGTGRGSGPAPTGPTRGPCIPEQAAASASLEISSYCLGRLCKCGLVSSSKSGNRTF